MLIANYAVSLDFSRESWVRLKSEDVLGAAAYEVSLQTLYFENDALIINNNTFVP